MTFHEIFQKTKRIEDQKKKKKEKKSEALQILKPAEEEIPKSIEDIFSEHQQ